MKAAHLVGRVVVVTLVMWVCGKPALSQNAVVDWNNITVKTITSTVSTAGITPTAGMTGIYLAYVNLSPSLMASMPSILAFARMAESNRRPRRTAPKRQR